MSPKAISELPSFPPITKPATSTCIVKRLYLCRHGETAANATGVLQGSGIDQPLNDKGARQAERLRDRLAALKVDLVVSSELKRAKQTASIVHEKHLDVPLIEIEDLAEISWGAWEGKQNPGLWKLLKSWETGNYSAKAPQGESPLEVEQRAVPVVYNLAQRPEKDIVVVVHGRLLRIIMSSIFYHSLAHMSSFTHHNTCINVVDVIIETDSAKVNRGTPDRFMDEEIAEAEISGAPKTLDDNIEVAPEEVTPDSPMLPDSVPQTLVDHPPHIRFVPIVLDSIDHLP